MDIPGIPGIPALTSDPMTAIAALVAALTLSSASGLRAYLPLLALAVGHAIDPNQIQLSQPFQQLARQIGAPWVIAILAILVVGETAVDKIPVLDHISDAFHTVVRPISGAIVMAAVSNPISDHSIIAAAVIGAVLALGVHATKTTTRPVVTVTTAGLGNPAVSFLEDVVTVITSILALIAPFIGFILLLIIVLAFARILYAAVKKYRELRQRPPAPIGGSSGSTTIPFGGGPA